jgi:hypothetical protein
MFSSSEARADFVTARRKAFWRRVRSWVFRGDNALLAFEDIRRQLHVQVQHEGGNREVPIEQIVGSVGRYRDFDRAFLPRGDRTRGRWESVDRAHHDGVGLPAIELYQLGETYFVKDGNHRVSVAREQGQKFIDARVIVVDAPAPITSADDIMDWIRDQDALAFHAKTRISHYRPGTRIDLTLPGQYEKLLEHIDTHRWYLGVENKREIGYDEAVQSWYDRVYLPTVEAIRSSGALREFSHRTEADLYLWITEHHWYMHQQGLPKGHGLEQLITAYATERSERPLKRLGRTMRRRAQP